MNTLLQNRTLGICLVIASLIALVLSGYSSYRSGSYARCQSTVTEQLIRAAGARAAAAEQDRQTDLEESAATALLIRTVFTVVTAPERVAAYDAYQQKLAELAQRRDAAAKEREANPLPEPPSQACS